MYSLITPKIAENFSSPAAMRSSTTDLNSFNCSANAELRTIIALAQFASEPTALNSNREDFRNLRDIQFHPLFPSYGLQVFRFAFTDVLQHGRELRTEEAGYDGRRSLIGAEPVSIAGTYDRRFQKPVVAVDRHQGIDDECDESEIVGKILARRHQCESCVSAERPVVVLAASVHSLERLFMQKDTESVVSGDFTHQGHDQHVVVVCQIALFVDGGQLELVNWFGATSLCRVLTGMPSLSDSISSSFMKAATLVGMAPK